MALRLVEPASASHRAQVALEEVVCEAIALATEEAEAFERISNAAFAGNRGRVVSLAQSGHGRALAALEEFRRFAGETEPHEPDVA